MKYLPYDASLALFELLRDICSELLVRCRESEAELVIRNLLELHDAASKQESRDQIVTGLVVSICPLQGNGLGDAVIWSACRSNSLHRQAEKLTSVTNELRAKLRDLYPSQEKLLQVQVEEAKEALADHFGLGWMALGKALELVVEAEFGDFAGKINAKGINAQVEALLRSGRSVADLLNS